MIITFDLLFFGALEIFRQDAPFHTTHSQFGHTTKEQDHKNTPGLATFKTVINPTGSH
jgi:hypothetical protein